MFNKISTVAKWILFESWLSCVVYPVIELFCKTAPDGDTVSSSLLDGVTQDELRNTIVLTDLPSFGGSYDSTDSFSSWD